MRVWQRYKNERFKQMFKPFSFLLSRFFYVRITITVIKINFALFFCAETYKDAIFFEKLHF